MKNPYITEELCKGTITSTSIEIEDDYVSKVDSNCFGSSLRLKQDGHTTQTPTVRMKTLGAVESREDVGRVCRPGRNNPPQPNMFAKCKEGARLAITRTRVAIQDFSSKEGAVSQLGKFNHRYVQPLFRYGGRNDRIFLCGQQAGRVMIRDGFGEEQHVIQAASHNYAGLYEYDADLLQLSIERLPVLVCPATEPLNTAMCCMVVEHFNTDFCVSTGSGYGANLLALSAILTPDWILLLDEKSHNSMFVAAYLSEVGQVRRFRHNDMTHLEDILHQSKTSPAQILVAVEGFYR